MSDRQKKKFFITLNRADTMAAQNLDIVSKMIPDCKIRGNTIETIGTRNMKAVAEIVANCKLQIRHIDFKKQSESKVEPKQNK